jgi:nucleotide-binding universal stress UspA family protein
LRQRAPGRRRRQGSAPNRRDPTQAILNVAEHEGCDAIVMAPNGERAMARMLVSSETMRLITHANIPVLIHPRN